MAWAIELVLLILPWYGTSKVGAFLVYSQHTILKTRDIEATCEHMVNTTRRELVNLTCVNPPAKSTSRDRFKESKQYEDRLH
jgi:hypothetical protein